MTEGIKTELRKEADKIANAPGFWPEPHQPSELAAAIQYPLDERWAARVVNAYVGPTIRRGRSK